jgi:predicted RNA-binding protein associated with RNAse of E/G family
MKRKFADRSNWRRPVERRFKMSYMDNDEFRGYVTAIYLDRVLSPLNVTVNGKEVCVIDSGFVWMQHFPMNSNHAMTTMFNRNREIVQWYFDISKEIGVDSRGIPYQDDLYLDVVVLPPMELELIDEDDLEEALRSRKITLGDYELAYREARDLMEKLSNGTYGLIKYCKKHLNYLDSLK